MNVLYISDHAVLEYDEVLLFTELGHDVFSLGAYHNLGHEDLPRPPIPGLKYQEALDKIYVENPNRTQLHPAIVEWAEVIVVMHSPNVIIQNWEAFKNKYVVWRSIGQSTPALEKKLSKMRDEGLKIVRYSPKESNIGNYIGCDAMIRFYKDPDVYKDWNGGNRDVVNFSQSLKGRRDFCHYDEIMAVIERLDGKVYGPGNEDLGKYNGGQVPYYQQIKAMQRAGAMVYGGTWPAPYTLSFIEALMTGTPIVAISKTLAHYPKYEPIDFYEVDEILGGISGIVCDRVSQMLEETERLLTDEAHANNIADKQRTLAVALFGKEGIKNLWSDFFGTLNGNKKN